MLKAVSIIMTAVSQPSQWEGKLDDGRMFYIRYRGFGLTLEISHEPTDDIMDAVRGKLIFKKEVDFEHFGMSTEEMMEHLVEHISFDECLP